LAGLFGKGGMGAAMQGMGAPPGIGGPGGMPGLGGPGAGGLPSDLQNLLNKK
jgi:signal recognition particle subunit SRP54